MLTRTLFNFPATNTEVGPSTPPIIAIALLFIFNATPTITDIIPTTPATIPNIFSLTNLLSQPSDLSISFYLPSIPYNSIRNTKILQTIPPQNRYSFKPSYLKKLFLLSSSSRIFCFITLVSVSDCFSRSFVALCIASIFACNAFLTSWTVFSLTSSFKLPISPDIAS